MTPNLQSPAPSCVGDCGNDGMVSSGDVVLALRIALGRNLDECPAIDDDANGDVDALVTAVGYLLAGECPL